ncbi:MAG: hypothetical protein HY306_01355 [Nitrosomonadales bacterium]|nr:hypothetical protein [Nitrosomonadales bacterium]
MSLRYLPEYAEAAIQALQLAVKEAAHLSYSRRTLFAQPIDISWVEKLSEREDLAEKIDAFVSRFARLQDHIGEKLVPRFANLLGEQPKSLLDVLAYAERMGWVESAEDFIGIRKLRNLLVHEYMSSPNLFLDALLSADHAAQLLLEIVYRLQQQARTLDLAET